MAHGSAFEVLASHRFLFRSDKSANHGNMFHAEMDGIVPCDY
jgi:hypothetical protein